jgi:hypothetical protein
MKVTVNHLKHIILTIAIIAIGAVPGFGFSFSLYDFGSSPFDHNNNWSPIDYPYGVGHQPSPGPYGEGGEKFDLEGLKVAIGADSIYIALANSFGYNAYSSSWGQSYRLGDLFIGVDNQYQYAIDIVDGGATGLYSVSSWNGLQDLPGSYYGTPVASQLGAHEMTSGTWLGDVTTATSFWAGLETDYLSPGNGDTYVWEFAIDRSLLGNFSNLSFHITLGCGNDLIEETVAPIPEPTTLMLFGLGLVGSVFIRRRKK